MEVTKFSQMIEFAKSKKKKRIIVAYGHDEQSIEAIKSAIDLGIIEATIVGDEEQVEANCKKLGIDSSIFEVIDEKDEMTAGVKSTQLINEGKGDVIMKGLIATDKYMKCILNKEKGLVVPRAILTHISVFELPSYHKLLITSDVAIIPKPDLAQKTAICNYLINAAQCLGIKKPKVAAICLSEKVNTKLPQTCDAALLSQMSNRGQIKGGIVDGPMALDLAIDKESCEIKKFSSPVGGDADCLLWANIEAGNVFYKTMTKIVRCELGAIVAGAKVPAILSSRGDSASVKLNSIVLSALLAK